MNWGSVDNFLAMGGYGFFVWGSYGVCVAAIAAEVFLQRLRSKRARANVVRLDRSGSKA